jgi:hypothetical protein
MSTFDEWRHAGATSNVVTTGACPLRDRVAIEVD